MFASRASSAAALAAVLALLAACGDESAPQIRSVLDIAEPYRGGAQILAAGPLTPQSGHVVRGAVSLQVVDGQNALVLGDDFFFEGSPDPRLALGADGLRRETLFASLEDNDGEQIYILPGRLDPSRYNEVWLWCEEFSVPLALAKLKRE